jgi:hypothetical protein
MKANLSAGSLWLAKKESCPFKVYLSNNAAIEDHNRVNESGGEWIIRVRCI